MKHIVTITFLMTCLSSKFTRGSDASTTCQSEMITSDLAAYIMETCDVPLEIEQEEIEKMITVDSDIGGPGYKKITFHIGDEYVGNQILIDYKNEENVCYTENSSEYFCPKAYSN